MGEKKLISTNNKIQPLRQTVTPEQQNKKLQEVGHLYEKQFLREMVKAMRSTVHESGLIKLSQAEQIFREQLDQEYVEKWGEKGGIGLSNLIYNQLIEKYGAQLGIRGPIEKPHGPLALNEKSNYNAQPMGRGKVGFQFTKDLDMPSLGMSTLKMPWSGKILGTQQLGADEYVLHMQHDNGLKSQLVFRGQPHMELKGEKLQAGDSIGLLSPEARAFFWNVEPVSKTVSE